MRLGDVRNLTLGGVRVRIKVETSETGETETKPKKTTNEVISINGN